MDPAIGKNPDVDQVAQEISDAIKNNLVELYLCGCELKNIPPKLESATNITYIDLSQNQISSLPPFFSNLENLRVLVLSSNEIENIPSELSRLVNLEELDLQNNLLAESPDNMSKLKKLDISMNNIEILNATNLPNIEAIDASNNKISQVSPEIAKSLKLTSLNLNHNLIENLPEEILTALRPGVLIIHLSNNRLSPEAIDWLTNRVDATTVLLVSKQNRSINSAAEEEPSSTPSSSAENIRPLLKEGAQSFRG